VTDALVGVQHQGGVRTVTLDSLANRNALSARLLEELDRALRDATGDPEVRAIVSSGYDNEDMARQYLDMGFCGYLTKPYRVTDLGKVIKAVVG